MADNTYGIEPEEWADLKTNYPEYYKNIVIENRQSGGSSGGGSANPLEPYPLFPKATKTAEIYVSEDFEYIGFLFNGLDLSAVNEDTVFKLTIGETSKYLPFSYYNSDGSISFDGLWVYLNEGRIFFSTDELNTAEVEIDVMPYGFIETFVINGTWGDDGIITDKSQSDFSDYCNKWGSKSRVELLIVNDEKLLFKEIITIDGVPAFVERGESIEINDSTASLSVNFYGYKWIGDNTVENVDINV